jgi:1,5-anhydro-D-fructose reductase (1,5-anhydro-D-mannitol-forming)
LTDLKVAVVGLGGIGALHAGITASLPGCQLVAAVDREARLVKIASKAISTVRFYTEVPEMLAREAPDIVYLCTPPTTHLPLSRSILQHPNRPRALFVEKPLAMNTGEAAEMVALAQQAGTITGVGFQRRFLPTVQKAKEFIDSGEIGEVRLARAHHFVAAIFEPGEGWKFSPEAGGVTLEMGVHLLDTMVSLFGEPTVLGRETARMFSAACEDYASAWLRFGPGTLASFEVGWSMWGFEPADFRIEVYGSRGGLTVTQDALTVFARPSGGSLTARTIPSSQLVGRLPILLGGVENVLIDMDFTSAVAAGRSPLVTFETGLRVNRVLDAIRATAPKG